jgi:hypothetical protein
MRSAAAVGGPALELRLYARPWGFRLEDIQVPVHLWHGEQDANNPIAMARHLAAAIPDCQASFYPGEGHLHFVDRFRRSCPPCIPRSIGCQPCHDEPAYARWTGIDVVAAREQVRTLSQGLLRLPDGRRLGYAT